MPTLKFLQRELYENADKWEDIGIQLDIDAVKKWIESDEDIKNCLK